MLGQRQTQLDSALGKAVGRCYLTILGIQIYPNKLNRVRVPLGQVGLDNQILESCFGSDLGSSRGEFVGSLFLLTQKLNDNGSESGFF